MAERFSVRDYKGTVIEDEKLDAILEAGRIAPTAANIQPLRVYVIKSEEGLSKICAITPCAFNAPVVLMVAYDADKQAPSVEPSVKSIEPSVITKNTPVATIIG